ncbi:hypothetical protein G9A89_001612 [Geosiphon pyriformis]|nr:hypothetical protein G9A89_001612 [Geosiphon pyriformis]
MENKEIKRTTRPYAHDCNECQRCQESIKYNRTNNCSECQFMFFEKHYKDFSCGYEEIDKIIKNPIYIPPNQTYKYGELNYYEWIPWERLSDINEIARGGFGIIYKATYIDGFIDVESIKHHGEMEYERHNNGMQVAIKIIPTNSSEVFKELYIQNAILINNIRNGSSYVSKILGITRNAETLEYGIVMEFAEHGDMRKYLSTNFHSTSWSNKLEFASDIAIGLSSIHSSGMVHRDLHSGNILQIRENCVNIGDLGLCQPTNHEATTTTITTEEKKIFGFTTAGDIYSLGMLLWELSTGKPPFYDCPHNEILIMAILNGQRPNITSPLIPPSIRKLIKKCWDANPKNRPTARELTGKFMELNHLYKFNNINNRFKRWIHFGKSDKLIRKTAKNDSIAIHSEAVYTSRIITAQMGNMSEVSLDSANDSLDVEQNDISVDVSKITANTLTAEQQEKEDERMLQGVKAFFCNRYSEAQSIFAERSDTDPLYALGRGCVSFLKAITTFNEQDISLAIKHLSVAETLANAELQASKPTIAASFSKFFGYNANKNSQYMSNGQLRSTVIKAESVLLIALVQLTQESIASYVKAGLNLRRGYKNYELVFEEMKKPGFNTPVDIHTKGGVEFGFGTCNLVLSFLAGKIIKIISVIGYKGNRELGVELVNASLQGRGIRSPLASLLFVGAYSIITSFAPSVLGPENIPKAEKYIQDALEHFPGSDFFTFFSGRNLRYRRDLDASTKAFKSVCSNIATDFGAELARLCQYELGMNAAMTLDWKAAGEYFKLLSEEHYWSKAFFLYSYAACLEMEGRKEEAIPIYTEVPNLVNRKFGGRTILIEQYVTRKVKQYISGNFANTLLPGLEILLIWNGFAFMKEQDLTRCLNIVNARLHNFSNKRSSINNGKGKKLLSTSDLIDPQATLHLIKASILNQLQQYTEATASLNWIFDHDNEINEEKFIVPFAYWESGVTAFLRGNTDRARAVWDTAAGFNGYEFEFRLAMRLHLALMKVKDMSFL